MKEFQAVGAGVARKDALNKVTGGAMYTGDIHPKGMLYGRMLGSPHAHALIKRIDVSKALALDGVWAVTGADAPETRTGYIQDRHILCKQRVRFVGDPVAAVAALTPELADQAIDLIEVEYEPLPAVFDVDEAFADHCPVVLHDDLPGYGRKPVPGLVYRFEADKPNVFIHRKIRHGDVEAGFEQADHIVEGTYEMPLVHHAAMETHSCAVEPHPDGSFTLWACEQGGVRLKYFICEMFGIESSKLRYITPYVGGGFGGKVDLMVTPIAMLLAIHSGRPVRMEMTREEVFVHGNPRSAAKLHIRDGVKRDGTIVARQITQLVNGGAYSGHVTVMVNSGAHGAVGNYRVPHFKLDAFGVHTNTPPTGPYRGLGAELMCFAIDSQMDRLADYLGMDKVEIRRKNLLVDGDVDANGQLTENNATLQALENAARDIGWSEGAREPQGDWVFGKGVSVGNKFTQSGTTSVVLTKAHDDGTIELRHYQIEMGQGCNTVLAQVAAEVFGTTPDKIKIVFDDSDFCPFDHGTFCSRGTFQNGNAVILACEDLKAKLLARAAEVMELPVNALDCADGQVFETAKPDNRIPFAKLFNPGGWVPKVGELLGSAAYSNPRGTVDPETGQGRPVAYYSYGALGVEVAVNVRTGEIRLERVVNWFDPGQVLNPELCSAQIEGAVAMGIGQTCFEETVYNEEGKIINPNFRDYKVPTMLDIPLNRDVSVGFVGTPYAAGPYGAKGIGEVALVPVMAAVANAINNAVGVQLNSIPLTRERLLQAIREKQTVNA